MEAPPPPVSGSVSQPAEPKSDSSNTPKPPLKYLVPSFNFTQTQEYLQALKHHLNNEVICYFISDTNSIRQNHPDLFLDRLKSLGHMPRLSMVLVSNGGSGLASLRIASILRQYCDFLQIIVPSRCASAATMLALAADEIVMSPAGYLTAIDSSITHELNPKGPDGLPVSVSVDQVKRIIHYLQDEGLSHDENGNIEGAYRTLFKYLHPMALGEIDRASSVSLMIAKRIMKMHVHTFGSEEKIDQLANHLINNYPAHGFPILLDEASAMGLPAVQASPQISDVLWDLVKAYDVCTNPATTHINEGHYKFHAFPVAIEAEGYRTAYEVNYFRRLNLINRKWQTEGDRTRWVNITKGTKPDSVSIKSIDARESPSTPEITPPGSLDQPPKTLPPIMPS